MILRPMWRRYTLQAGDHSAKVTDIKVNTELQHFLTCSLDGTVKVFDAQKRLESALAMESPIACVCYLNNSGDIVAGTTPVWSGGGSSSAPSGQRCAWRQRQPSACVAAYGRLFIAATARCAP